MSKRFYLLASSLVASLTTACGGGQSSSGTGGAASSTSAETTSSVASSSSGTSTSSASSAASSSGAGGGSAVDCSKIDESYNVPPPNLPGWSAVLSQTGMMTLTHDTGHIHDDSLGPLGYCAANAAAGKRYLKLVSARFETDQQDQNFPSDKHCVTDYAAPDPTFQQYGMCWSGGNVAIYVEVRDEMGKRVVAGFDAFIAGMTIPVMDQGKPPNEFPMNFPMSGHNNQRYGVRARYQHPTDGDLVSDVVTNMRLALNHHVNYLLTFQVDVAP